MRSLLRATARFGRARGRVLHTASAVPTVLDVVGSSDFHTSKSTPNQLVLALSKNSAVDNGAEFVVSTLDDLANWARKGSIWPMTFGLA